MRGVFINLGKHFGGAESYLLSILNQWLTEGNEAIVITRKDSEFSHRLKSIEIIKIYEVNLSIYDAYRINKLLRKMDFDFLNINGINSGVFINLFPLNIPKITTVHSSAEMDRINKTKLVRKLFSYMEYFCLKKSNKIIVVSEELKRSLSMRGFSNDKIHFIPNGVNPIINYPKKSFRIRKSQKLKVVYVGRLETVKGCMYLIEALKQLSNISIECDIFGDGVLLDSLKNQAKSVSDNIKINFKGFSNNVRTQLINYDVIVLPSLFEAFPMTILEAMNARVLVIASNVGGIPYVLSNGINGYMFERKNYLELAELLVFIYENPMLQIPVVERAYEGFLKNYTDRIMIKRTFDLFRKVN